MKAPVTLLSILFTIFTLQGLSGQEWELILENTGSETLEAISFPDSVHGWLVGSRPGDNKSYILHSNDQGVSWNEQTGVLNTALTDVFFSDTLTGYVLGVSSLQKTEDGGVSWTEVDLGTVPQQTDFQSFDFSNSSIWILGGNGHFFMSTDSGISWEEKEKFPNGIYYDVAFHGQDTGIIVGQIGLDAVVFQSTDGGATWTDRTVESPIENANLKDVFFADDTTAFTGGRGGRIYRSQDGGSTWNETARLEYASTYLQPESFHFLDANKGWVVCAFPPREDFLFIYRTADGGKQWTQEIAISGSRVIPGDILFDESGNGWTCGYKQSASGTGAYVLRRVPIELPEAICKDTVVVYIDETGSAYITPETIDNGSSDNSGIIDSMWVDKDLFRCGNIYFPETVTLYVSDPAGNVSTCKSEVTILDSIMPVAICKDISIMLDSSGTADLVGQNVDDGSYDNCSYTFSLDRDHFTTEDIGIQTVTMTVTDGTGNQASCTSNVTVNAYDPVSVAPGKTTNQNATLTVYPNPFSSQTSLGIGLLEESRVSIKVYTVTGQLVEHVFEGELHPGNHRFAFSSDILNEGMYICVLEAGSELHHEVLMINSR